MPTYCYKCDKCSDEVEGKRPEKLRDVQIGCSRSRCHGLLVRDRAAEFAYQREQMESGALPGSGKTPAMESLSGGVCPGQIAEANRDPKYADLGVKFDERGVARIPRGRGNKDKFLKARGFVDLGGAKRRNTHATTITASSLDIDGTGRALER